MARTLGCSFEELEERISAHEFGEWMALFHMEPWGETRFDLAIGNVSATLANIHRKETARPFSALDFCPYLRPRAEVKEMSPADFMKTIAKNG